MLSNLWGSSARPIFVNPDAMLFMVEKGFTMAELNDMDGSELKYWYIETLNRHNREVKRQNDANKA